jgi:hypothetical protein
MVLKPVATAKNNRIPPKANRIAVNLTEIAIKSARSAHQ